ncbi:MAG TPA: hypothetical protein PKW97_13935, partial [Syntrophorhabdus sp.]|nr:hypothetical protein [Syntrophorhabdus sp.]
AFKDRLYDIQGGNGDHLLIHPDDVPVSLKDCDELAPEEGAKSGWELAGRYASRMLPQVFRQDSPVFEVVCLCPGASEKP